MQLCTGTRKDGTACTARALPEGVFCFGHDPEQAAKRAEVVRRGGQNKATAIRAVKGLPAELADVPARLRKMLEQVEQGKLHARTAEAFCALTGRLLDIMRYADERAATKELERRISALEELSGSPRRGAA